MGNDDHFFHRHALAKGLSARILSTAVLAPGKAAPRDRRLRLTCSLIAAQQVRSLAQLPDVKCWEGW
jgi:hypothetical protein